MNISSCINTFAAGGTTLLGVVAMDAKEFNPLYLFFHLIVIILTSVIVGFMAEIGFNNMKKYVNDRLGK